MVSFWRFVSQVNQSFKASQGTSLISEAISNFQIMQLIIFCMQNFATHKQQIIHATAKIIPFATGAFAFHEYYENPNTLHILWFIGASYVGVVLMILLFLLIFSFRKKLDQVLMRIFSLIVMIHSRVLFFPLQFFFLSIIRLSNEPLCTSSKEFYCNSGWRIATIIFCCLNFILAAAKEFVFSLAAKTKDFGSVKTNLYYQTILIYKITLVIFLLGNNNNVAMIIDSILHLVFNSALLYILYSRLPFFKFKVLKMTIIMTSVNFCLSFKSVLQSLIKNDEVKNSIQIFMFLLPLFGIKAALSIFKSLFERIIYDKNPSPFHVIHFSLLMKEFALEENDSYILDKNFFPDVNKFYGILCDSKIDFVKLRFSAENKNEKSLLYACVIEKLERCLGRHSESSTLIVFLAQLYLKKSNNFNKAFELLKKLEAQKSSFHARKLKDFLNLLIKKFRQKELLVEENKFNLDNFFKQKELVKLLRSEIKSEINEQLEFWKSLQTGSVDILTTVKKAKAIDSLFIKIDKQFQKDRSHFQANFQLPLLLYAVYLNNVRHLHMKPE